MVEWFFIYLIKTIRKNHMSMALCFCSIREQYLIGLLKNDIDFDDIRKNDENQYADVMEASFEYYTDELLELLGEGNYPLSELLFLADDSTSLYEINGAVLYDVATVSKVVKAFAATDLQELAENMGYHESEAKNNDFSEYLQQVHDLFIFAEDKNINVIGFTL